jgi:hypothetical protein
VVDGAAADIGGEQAVAEEVLVQGQVREQPVLGQRPGKVGCTAGLIGRGVPMSTQAGRSCMAWPGVGVLAGQSPASRSRLGSSRPGWGSGGWGWRVPGGGWAAWLMASGAVRPTSADQLWTAGQSR